MRLDHVNVRCTDLAATADFFHATVGLTIGARPPFAFPGHWLYDASGRAVIHLLGAPKELGPLGAVDHVAFYFDDFDAQLRHLQSLGHTPTVMPVPGTPISQCFVMGPDGLQIEFQGPRTG